MTQKSKVIAVCARMGDPLFQAARARSIWTAQTAQACKDIGLETMMVGSGRGLPIKVEGPEGVTALKRLVAGYYNVDGNFGIVPLYPPPPNKDNPEPFGRHEAGTLFPLYVQPYVDLVHTRDPRIVQRCIDVKIPVIYEDHNEDYQLSDGASQLDLNHPMVRAVVAITISVADRLVLMGVSRTKIIVQDSGVNQRAFERTPDRTLAWRRSMLRSASHDYLAVYTGGMQEERGIAHILTAAQHMPDVMFVMAGGNERDVASWTQKAKGMHLTNVRFLGYLPQDQVIELQQAADVVLMTRQAGARGAISSPLKFFEYLATGAPMVCAQTPMLMERDNEGIAMTWYDPECGENLVPALRESFKSYPRRPDGYQNNMDHARAYTWQERQKKIISFAKVDDFRT